ncbi:MAG: TetR/AcrR family transcriptional regulator, partial [Acidobacteria bacterium]|nr:TetR/AcrR family transcriptional regulator [Acidobacteriota bacterium]
MARRKEFSPEEALDRAMDLFWRRGYGASSLGRRGQGCHRPW